jgi:hypothetical protein
LLVCLLLLSGCICILAATNLGEAEYIMAVYVCGQGPRGQVVSLLAFAVLLHLHSNGYQLGRGGVHHGCVQLMRLLHSWPARPAS